MDYNEAIAYMGLESSFSEDVIREVGEYLETELELQDLDTAIKANDIYTSDVFFNEVMIKRDLRVLRLIKDEWEKE